MLPCSDRWQGLPNFYNQRSDMESVIEQTYASHRKTRSHGVSRDGACSQRVQMRCLANMDICTEKTECWSKLTVAISVRSNIQGAWTSLLRTTLRKKFLWISGRS